MFKQAHIINIKLKIDRIKYKYFRVKKYVSVNLKIFHFEKLFLR